MALPNEKSQVAISTTYIHWDQENYIPTQPYDDQPKRRALVLGRVGLCAIVAGSSITIIGLICHSLRSYSNTKNIKFSGLNLSWPTDLNLLPAYYFLAVSALSIVVSLAISVQSFRQRNSIDFSVIDKVFMVFSIAMFAVWIAGDILQTRSEETPKKDVLKWACRRRNSPTNALVSYAVTCDEQVYFYYPSRTNH